MWAYFKIFVFYVTTKSLVNVVMTESSATLNNESHDEVTLRLSSFMKAYIHKI